MRSGGNKIYDYFTENQLTKLAHLVQYKPVHRSCLKKLMEGLDRPALSVYATGSIVVGPPTK